MIQVCDPPRTRQARRLSAEEFCGLLRSEVSSIYRPRSEVLRMITVGEMWGICGARSERLQAASFCRWTLTRPPPGHCAAFWAGAARRAGMSLPRRWVPGKMCLLCWQRLF